MMVNWRGIKARPRDIDAMIAHNPSLVELHCSLSDLDWRPSRKYDVPMVLHVPEYDPAGELLDPASTDEDKFRRAQQVYVKAAAAAAAMTPYFTGWPMVVFHPGGDSPATADDATEKNELRYQALARTIDAMQIAAGKRVRVLLENMPRSCWFFGGSWKANIVVSGKELAALGRRYGIGVTLDLCHLYLSCVELRLDYLSEVEAALASGMVRHVHYSDARGTDGEGLQIGEGDLPLTAAIDLVEKYAPGVIAVPEIWFGHENGGAAFVEAWRRVGTLKTEKAAAS